MYSLKPNDKVRVNVRMYACVSFECGHFSALQKFITDF